MVTGTEAKKTRQRRIHVNIQLFCSLYNAFADQLRTRYSEKISYQELRKSAAEYMRNNPDDFTPFLYLEDGNFDKYCNDIENTAAWGGQLEVKYH